MTPREVINSATLLLGRPDLVQAAESKFYSCLKSAHSNIKTPRDFKTKSTATISRYNSTATIALPSEVREVLGLRQYSDFTMDVDSNIIPGTEIVSTSDFVNAGQNLISKDYYGFAEPRTYIISGANINIRGLSDSATAVGISTVAWPTFRYSPTISDFISDSWILAECPQVVESYLLWHLSKIHKDKDSIAIYAEDIRINVQYLTHVFSSESL